MDNVVKISIVGSTNVGKSSIKRLLEGDVKDPSFRQTTIGVDIGKIIVDDTTCILWDLGGQNQFHLLWDQFMKDTNLTIVVTDSTEKNVDETKDIVERFNRFQGSKVIAIANKQDVPGALPPEEVGKRLGLKTYGAVAVDGQNASKLMQILRTEL